MTNIIVKEFNSETGEEIERKATAEEIAQIEADKAESKAEQDAAAAQAAKKQEVLAKLGLTADEVSALLA